MLSASGHYHSNCAGLEWSAEDRSDPCSGHFEPRETCFEAPETRIESREDLFISPEIRFKAPETRIKPRETRFISPEVRFISRDTRIEPCEIRLESRKILNESSVTGMAGIHNRITGRGE